MATELERLHVLIEANTKSYERAMVRLEQKTDRAIRKSRRHFGKLDRSLKKTQTAALAFGKSFLAGFGIGGATALPFAIARTTSELSKLVDTADKLGVGVEFLQQFRFAAKQFNVETTAADMGLQRFTRRLGEARQNTGELLKTVQLYNIQLSDSNGQARSATEILKDFADIVAHTEDEQERLRIAFKLFDSEGAALVNVLRQGSDGMQTFMDRASELGIVADETARKGKKLDDRWTEIKQTFDSAFKTGVINVAGAFETLGNKVSKFLEHARAMNSVNMGLRNTGPGGVPAFLGDPSGFLKDFQIGDGGKKPPKLPTKGLPEKQQNVIDALRFEGEQLKRTAAEQDLYNKLKQAGVQLQSKTGQQIAELVEKNRALSESQRSINEQMQFFGGMATDALSSIIVHGENAADTMKRLAASLADAALNALLLGQGPLAGAFGTASGGRQVGGLIGSVFGGGRAGGGPVMPGRAYLVGEKRPELFVPKTAGTIVPKVGSGGPSTIMVSVDISGANGDEAVRRIASEATAAGVSQGLAAYDHKLPGRIRDISVRMN